MTEENQEEKESEDKDKKLLFVLYLSVAIISLALISVISAIWLFSRKEIAEGPRIVTENSEENGSVRGATTADSEYLANLALSLKKSGFILFGTGSNNDTIRQKQILGQAFSALDYVECESGVKDANLDECAAKNIDKYPTWVKGEKKFAGFKNLSELEELLQSEE